MLTHVCKWTAHGWETVTAEEVVKQHPYTVPAQHELFFCEICGQSVTFVKGDIQSAHFRHNSAEERKDCEQRTRNLNRLDWTRALNPPILEIPINICVTHYDFYFERDGERLSTAKIIDEMEGALFSERSGKRLPLDADVRIDKKYYLLTSKGIGGVSSDVNINFLARKSINYRTWRLYEVEATALTEEAAKFFLHYHCRLTDNPIKIRVLYPLYTFEPYCIRHDAQELYVYVGGNAKVALFPYANNILLSDDERGKLIKIDCNERQQLTVVAGRSQPLKYLYLRRGLPTFEIETPTVEVNDVAGAPIVDGVLKILPKDRMLRLRAGLDGYVEIIRGGFIDNRIDLKADEWLNVTALDFGVEVKIYIGLDCVRTIRFERATSAHSLADEELYLRLERGGGRPIKISHSFGALVDRLKDYPKVKGWLYKRIRAGFAPEEAYNLFRRFLLSKGLI